MEAGIPVGLKPIGISSARFASVSAALGRLGRPVRVGSPSIFADAGGLSRAVTVWYWFQAMMLVLEDTGMFVEVSHSSTWDCEEQAGLCVLQCWHGT